MSEVADGAVLALANLCVELRREKCADPLQELHFDPLGRARDGLMLDVLERGHRLWSGVFAFGDTAYDFFSFIPNVPTLVVISHGQGYVTAADEEHRWRAIPTSRLHGAIVAPSGCIVCYNAWALYVIWNSDRIGVKKLAADGISDVHVRENSVFGKLESSSGKGIQRFDFPLTESNCEMLENC